MGRHGAVMTKEEWTGLLGLEGSGERTIGQG